MFEAIDAFITEVRTGRIEPKESLITRIGILSIPGALLEAIDTMITFRCFNQSRSMRMTSVDPCIGIRKNSLAH